MHDAWKVIVGLVIFLVIITFPLWYNASMGRASYTPELVVKTADVAGSDTCVMPTEYMKTQHMDLLNQWREEVVRQQDRVFVAEDGRVFNKSLTNTCFDCHSNKDEFCDRCHDYMGVDPYCYDCHIQPSDLQTEEDI